MKSAEHSVSSGSENIMRGLGLMMLEETTLEESGDEPCQHHKAVHKVANEVDEGVVEMGDAKILRDYYDRHCVELGSDRANGIFLQEELKITRARLAHAQQELFSLQKKVNSEQQMARSSVTLGAWELQLALANEVEIEKTRCKVLEKRNMCLSISLGACVVYFLVVVVVALFLYVFKM